VVKLEIIFLPDFHFIFVSRVSLQKKDAGSKVQIDVRKVFHNYLNSYNVGVATDGNLNYENRFLAKL